MKSERKMNVGVAGSIEPLGHFEWERKPLEGSEKRNVMIDIFKGLSGDR